MKRKVRMKRFKIGFSLLMSFVMIFGVLQYALTAKQQPVQAAADITTSNYKTWTAPTLEEARTAIKNFLEPKKGSDTTRPYKDNKTWQEGSLAALDKVYYAAIEPDTGISSDLSRQQLIQTVRGLELYDSKAYNARNIALNDYPNDELSYNMAQIMNGTEDAVNSTYLSTMIFTDNSSSLSEVIPGMEIKAITKTSFVYIRDSIQSYLMSRSINLTSIDPYITKSGVVGFFSGAPKTAAGGTTVNLPVDDLNVRSRGADVSKLAWFNGTTTDMPYYTWLQNSNPVHVTSNITSNPAAYVRWASAVFNGKNTEARYYDGYGAYAYFDTINLSVRPVLIVHSSYEFPSEAMKQDFLKSLDEFEHDAARQEKYNTLPPIFIQVSYKRPGAANYDPMVDKIFTPARIAQGWRHLEVNSENAGTPDNLAKRINALDVFPRKAVHRKSGVVGYLDSEGSYLTDDPAHFHPISEQTAPPKLSWSSVLSTNLFDFVPNTFGSSVANQNSITANELRFSGPINGGLTSFDLTGKDQTYSSYKMGDKAPAYTKAELDYSGSPGSYNSSPNLYVPLSDAAVELYTYSGTGSETAASSYKLKNTIVSNTYDNYEGTSYSLKSSQLASKKYGTVLSQTDLKNAVKEAMGDAAYNSLNFTNSDSLNASSLTVKFDASKNVYKLYAKEVPTTSTITIEHWIKDGGKIATSTQADIQKTGNIGDLANITPTVISGYTYVNSDSDPLGQVKYDATSKTVKLYYTENPKTSTITIEHWISGGGKITTQSDLSKSGTSGQPANITPTAIDGYTYVNSDSDPLSSVTFGDTNRTVKLYYTENPKEGTVTIEYWDSDTNAKITSQSDLVLKGESGTDVNYTQKDITGYAFDKDRSDNVPSKFTEGTVTVRQYYSKVYTVTIEYWDSSTNSKITTEANTVITGKKDAVLNYSPKELDGYIYDSVRSDKIPATITGDATYRAYYNKAGAVTIEYWSSDTNQKIAGQSDEVLKGILDAKVTITPKEISGYKFDASRSDSLDNITYKTGSNTIRLYYTQYINLTVIFEKISPKEELGKVVVKAKIGDTVHLENDFSDVKTKLAELENSYRLSERPTDYAAYKVPTDDATVTYLFDGTLFLSSAPSLLEFGSGHKIMQLGEYESELPTYDKPLTVTDTRATLTNWTISVKLTEDMHSRKKPSFILKDVLYYKDGSKMTPVTSGGPIDIVTSKHSARGDYDVSETEWKNKSNGFIFKLGKNQYRDIDDYDGTLEFALTEAP